MCCNTFDVIIRTYVQESINENLHFHYINEEYLLYGCTQTSNDISLYLLPLKMYQAQYDMSECIIPIMKTFGNL